MDDARFDGLTRTLAGLSTRRGLAVLLATLPSLGGALALLDRGNTEAKRRRKKGDRHDKRQRDVAADKKRKSKKKPCKPKPKTATCAGKCGPVKNNCKKTVDCGPCDCDPPCGACETCADDFVCELCDPCCNDICCEQAKAICHADNGQCCVPDSKAQTCDTQCGDVINNCGVTVDCGDCACAGGCPACLVCDVETGDCVPDPTQEGDDCGDAGQVCQADGACACEAGSCPDCTTCENDGFCAPCADCCDATGNCQDGETNAACGSSDACDVCTGQEECQDQQCVCMPDCAGKVCGSDGCGNACGSCGDGQVCTTQGQCCSPTTCAALYQTMCQIPGDCDYGICGTFPDGCGSTLDCGACLSGHPCFACENNICVHAGGVVCGEACCSGCCVTPGTGLCGFETCADGDCCPVGFNCCNGTVNGSPRSTCYNILTYCQGNGLFCCEAGNTCCTNEPCCTSNSQCTGGRRCLSGCCSFNF